MKHDTTDGPCECGAWHKPVDQIVLLEEMPDHLRASHRAARNWGAYPHNGAVRRAIAREEAEVIIAADPDGYARIVEVGS